MRTSESLLSRPSNAASLCRRAATFALSFFSYMIFGAPETISMLTGVNKNVFEDFIPKLEKSCLANFSNDEFKSYCKKVGNLVLGRNMRQYDSACSIGNALQAYNFKIYSDFLTFSQEKLSGTCMILCLISKFVASYLTQFLCTYSNTRPAQNLYVVF